MSIEGDGDYLTIRGMQLGEEYLHRGLYAVIVMFDYVVINSWLKICGSR